MTNDIDTREILHQTALNAPNSSGVYLWRNQDSTVIYVGKAKNLKNRLSSYFSGRKDIKTQMLIAHAVSIEYITTTNEYEAFLLENNLIKKYSPRYNINLKDGKSYPSLKITKEDFPKIVKTRRVIKDGSLYFGPFPDAAALDIFIKTLFKLYPIRRCKTMRKGVACMYYHIGQCKAPCCSKIDKKSYNQFIEEIRKLLENKGEQTQKKIEREMKEAAKNLDFEKAARLRDGLKALMVMQNQNIVETFSADDRDYCAFEREGEMVSFSILSVRLGKLTEHELFRTKSLSDDENLMGEFLCAYYDKREKIPPAVFLPKMALADENGSDTDSSIEHVRHWFAEQFGFSPEIQTIDITSADDDGAKPYLRRTNAALTLERHRATLRMAQQNAREDIIRRARKKSDTPAMQELQRVLRLPNLPRRIEGFDIAHIGGKFPVASLISFFDGNPDKKNYREFRLKTTDGIIDDFASMKEATARRYTRLLNDGKELPDLLLIDGGIGQVNAVDAVISSLGLSIPIAGLAKRDEEIWRPHTSTPICLPKHSDALRLLQRVRDETHRFATSRNQELRTKENTVSPFESLPHVGKQRARLLRKAFTTLEDLAAAQEAQIAQAIHVRASDASEILLAAKKLAEKQRRSKKRISASLTQSGTTAEKAAEAARAQNLALLAAEDEADYS